MNTIGMPQSNRPASLGASCRVCGSTTDLRRCSSCKSAFYCSQTHQQCDWRNHRLECKQIRSQLDASLVNQQNVHAIGYDSVIDPTQYSTLAQSYNVNVNNGWQQPMVSRPAQIGGQHAYLPNAANVHSDRESGVPSAVIGVETTPTYEVAAARMQADRERKERDFRNLSENTMRINDVNLSNTNMMAR